MVIDTCIFIEYLRARDKSTTTLFKISGESELFLSVVTLYELYMGADKPDKKSEIQAITEDLTILPFTVDVAVKAGEIYHQLKRTNQLIEFRDIFIAATCLTFNQPILTTNKKHFKRVDDLKIFN